VPQVQAGAERSPHHAELGSRLNPDPGTGKEVVIADLG
jgi:hypothetical protein